MKFFKIITAILITISTTTSVFSGTMLIDGQAAINVTDDTGVTIAHNLYTKENQILDKLKCNYDGYHLYSDEIPRSLKKCLCKRTMEVKKLYNMTLELRPEWKDQYIQYEMKDENADSVISLKINESDHISNLNLHLCG